MVFTQNKPIYILGIESSCDDTAVSIISSNKQILSNIVINQNQQHAPYQGVVPEIASRMHMQNLEQAIKMALTEANFTLEQIDAIAATSGPGLIGGVIIGCMIGKTIASVLKKPFIAINHLEGHALSARLCYDVTYPYLLLLASGGHCQFIQVNKLGDYVIIGQTLDDAAGEAFDKVAKMLGLGFPGGPLIEKHAKHGDPYKYLLPRPLLNQSGCNLSFSGLKTSVRLLIESLGEINLEKINDVAASFQYTVSEIFKKKLESAIKIYEQSHKNKNFVLAGGVAANEYIKNVLTEVANKCAYQTYIPDPKLCTDNAAMIAWAGVERYNAGYINKLNFCPRARWGLEELKFTI